MAKKSDSGPTPPRKRRTREHVIADLSMNFVERLIFENGYAVLRPMADYGYDLALETYDEAGYPEPGLAYLQLKATDHLGQHEGDDSYWVQLDMRDCRRWIEEPAPVFLVLFDATRKRGFWLDLQDHFHQHPVTNPQADSIRVS